mgnify:FL=1|jgi:hypothetical protein
MANKVASKRWIYSNFSVGSSSNECATKTEILGFGLYITNDSSYASNQLVREEDIYLPAWQYSFSVSDWDKNIGEYGGTTSSISISSTKSRLGETESVGWSIDNSTVPSWITWNSSDMTFTVSSNSSTSSRTADIYFEQDESGNRDYARVTQSGHTPVAYYDYIFWTSASGGTTISGSFEQSGSYIQPGIYSYRETIIDGTVVSRDPVSFSYTDIPSWITGDAVSTGYNPPNAPTYYAKMTASENTSVDARSYDVVITQSGSDKEITISVSQPGKANDTYVFTISPSTYDTTYSGGTVIPRTTSTKNGSNIGYSLTSGGTDWVVVDMSGNFTIEVLKNTSTSSRSATLVFTQNESGLKCYVYINQSGYTPTYTYTFTVIPTNLGVTAAETNETLTVESYKTVLESDGSKTTESLDYEFSSNRDWVNAARTTTNTTYITVAENLTTIQRSARITLTQAESGAQAFTNVIQAGKVQSSNKLTITSITYDEAYLFPPGITPVAGSTMYLKFLIPNTFTWKTSSGLSMNRGTAYAGDTCNIYVFENSRYRLVRTFTLQTGEQTIAI